MIKEFVIEYNTRRHNFYNISFDDPLGLLGIFKLFTDCNTVTCAHYARKVGIQLMVRESGQRDLARSSIVAFGQRDATCLCRCNCIVAKRFIEIAESEEQYRIRMAPLDLIVLPHERRFLSLFHRGIYESVRPA